MTTRHSDEWNSRSWSYPVDLPGFLKALGVDLDDRQESQNRVGLFMMLPVARRMPVLLRRQLVEAGILDPQVRPREIPHI